MKRFCLLLLSLCLIFSLVPLNTASAITAPVPVNPPSTWGPPVITPLTGDKDFTVKSLDPISLAFGTVKTGNDLVVPAGFPLGEKQFGGDVAQVTDFDAGTARACFSLPTYRYGWKGGIFQWDGSRWKSIPSTLTEGIEGGAATVCATINGNGTYALIIGFSQPEKPVSSLPVCSADFTAGTITILVEDESETTETIAIILMFINQPFPQGTRISYNIIDVYPAGVLSGALHQTGSVFNDMSSLSMIVFLSPDDLQELIDSGGLPTYIPPSYTHLTFHHVEGWEDMFFTVRVTTPTCYKDFTSEDFLWGYGPD